MQLDTLRDLLYKKKITQLAWLIRLADDYKDDDDRNIFDRLFGTQGDLDPVTGMPTAEAVKQRNLAQYGTETSNYMEDPFAPPSQGSRTDFSRYKQ